MQAEQEGVAVSGQNMANANNPAYAREQLQIEASTPLPTTTGQQGTGADAVAITEVRDALLDAQIRNETSVTGSLQSQQTALQYVQAALGEQLSSSGATGTVGSDGGLDNDLSGLFNSFQALSANPSSLTNRQTVISAAQQLAAQFNQVNQQLSGINSQLNQSVQTDVTSANHLLTQIAGLNQQIVAAQASSGGTANDLIDQREQALESLANLASVQSSANANGSVNISLDGHLLVSGATVDDTLQTYDGGGGQLLVSGVTSGTPLALSGGTIAGTIAARDNGLASLSTGINALASQLISQVNSIYQPGYDLNGHKGASLFSGANAGDISVTASVVNDPSTLQASGVAGDAGNNQVALALAQLANAPQAGLANQTFSQSYNGTATDLGSALATVNSQLSDQQTVQTMLQNQRSSVSGVSLDQEMTNMVSYEKAYQVSAELVTTLDQMLTTVIGMKQSP